MIRFIQYFLMYWRDYDGYYWFTHVHTQPQVLAQMGGDPFKNRFHYAWDCSVRWWKHRDKYSRKCDGRCGTCKAKHC